MKTLFTIAFCVYVSIDLAFSRDVIDNIQDCKKTELYAQLSKRDVVIYVKKFNLNTGKVMEQRPLRGSGKVPKSITDIMPLMNREHFKNDQYIYAYDKQRGQHNGGYTLLMVNENKVDSLNSSITIKALVGSFQNTKLLKKIKAIAVKDVSKINEHLKVISGKDNKQLAIKDFKYEKIVLMKGVTLHYFKSPMITRNFDIMILNENNLLTSFTKVR